VQLQDQYDRFQALHTEVLALTTHSLEYVQAVQESLQPPYPLLCDADHAVASRYGVYDQAQEALEPALFVVSRHDGRIAHVQIGYSTPDSTFLDPVWEVLEEIEQRP
jgi:peroxiredoxin